LTLTPTPTPTSTRTPGIGSTQVSAKDGMVLVYVPAGEFLMGTTTDQLDALLQQHDNWKMDWFTDEQPQHTVYLDAFWIDRTEVTNGQYAKCVEAGVCKQPGETKSSTRSRYYDNPDYANYPVIYVDWDMAVTYCQWAGRRLPTEAEWEKAARGTDERLYPWGNSDPGCELANYNVSEDGITRCIGDTMQVGSYPGGASPYGALDMAGNVWEWVADWYSMTYYSQPAQSNPLGPTSGQYRVVRGGAWNYLERVVRSANRDWFDPGSRVDYGGFRCAASH